MPITTLLFSFQGRVPRKVIWLYTIVTGVFCAFVAFLADGSWLQSLVQIPLWWSWFAVVVKRFHDRDRSAWWLLLLFIPLIDLFAAFELFFLRGTRGGNRFGEDRTGKF